MSKCAMCGETDFRDERLSQVFTIDGKRVLVEDIPARVCTYCGEPLFSRETTEKVRRMVHGETTPIGVVTMDVYAFA